MYKGEIDDRLLHFLPSSWPVLILDMYCNPKNRGYYEASLIKSFIQNWPRPEHLYVVADLKHMTS